MKSGAMPTAAVGMRRGGWVRRVPFKGWVVGYGKKADLNHKPDGAAEKMVITFPAYP
jgi:hypothetical protein